MATTTWTYNTQGNLRAAASLAAGANFTLDIDLTAKIEGLLTVRATLGGTVAATHGIRVEAFPRYGTTPSVSTLARGGGEMLISDAASATGAASFFLGSGLWQIRVLNLDATNAITTVEVTLDTLDGIE